MNSTDNEVLSIFKETKALLEGHFILRSGLRSGHFFQCAQVCQHLDKVTRLAELLIAKIEDLKPTTVVSPAMGGLVIGQEVARQLNCRFLFLEKEDDRLVMRRNFKLTETDRVLIVEDVVTRGGRVREARHSQPNSIRTMRSGLLGRSQQRRLGFSNLLPTSSQDEFSHLLSG